MTTQEEDETKERARRAKAFERRTKAATQGIHLPNVAELYRLSPFCGSTLNFDAQTFSERLMSRVKGDSDAAQAARESLAEMTVLPDIEVCVKASLAFDKLEEGHSKQRELWTEARRRCQYYAASLGHVASMWRVAATLSQLADNPNTPPEVAFDYIVNCLGWLLIASDPVPALLYRQSRLRDLASSRGRALLERAFQEQERSAKAGDPGVKEGAGQNFGTTLLSMQGRLPGDFNTALEGDVAPSPSVVVFASLGNTDVGDGKKVAREFREVNGKPLPLVPVPDLSIVGNTLNAEFPYAVSITSVILSDLAGKPYVQMRPTIFVGPPGCGKTSYVERLLDLLNVPNETYPCGGISDSSLAGTARRWSSGEPSLPVSVVRRYACASPGIILDEIEKASLSRRNGSVFDALLGLFEVQSARHWLDPYIQASADLSHVIWVGTANDLKGVPAPLVDRCRVMRFPEPKIEHLPSIAQQMLKHLVVRRGLNPAWAMPLTTEELDAMSALWRTRSLRVLERLVEAVFIAREKGMARQ